MEVVNAADLTVIAERADAATPGPWIVEEVGDFLGKTNVINIVRWRGHGMTNHAHFDQDRATADFVAAARFDVPALLAEVLRLQEGIQQAITLHSVEGREAYVIADHLQGLLSEVRA